MRRSLKLLRAAAKEEASLLLARLEEHVGLLQAEQHVVAYSGGVDSAVVAGVVHRVHRTKAEAVLGVSPSLPRAQRELAESVARFIGIKLVQIETDEGSSEQYLENKGQACYACKSALYRGMNRLFESVGERGTGGSLLLYNGTNADDVRDTTRVGIVAAREFRVASPLQEMGLTKADVRAVATELRLPNAQYAASPCLRSRLGLGVRATPPALVNVERAELIVRSGLSSLLTPAHNLRVRHLLDNSARIELDAELLEEAEISGKLSDVASAVANLGYAGVSFKIFRSGSNSV